jgi:MSHA biogenesis protein MshQ
MAQTYSIPSGPLPPGCTADNAEVECPSLSLGNNVTVNITEQTKWTIIGDWSFGNGLSVNESGTPSELTIIVTGNLTPGNGPVINASLAVGGNIAALNNSEMTGPMVVGGNLQLGNNSIVTGGIDVSGSLSTGTGVIITGSVSATSIDIGQNTQVTGNLQATTVSISGSGAIIDGNINATGSVLVNGTVTGYINAPDITVTGTVEGPTCDVNDNEGACSGPPPAVQFYRIDHNTSYLTCLATELTISACTSSDCSSTLSIDGSLLVTASGPAIVSAVANFSNQPQVTLSLPVTLAGNYELSLSNENPVASSPYQCASATGCLFSAVDTALTIQVAAVQTAGDSFPVLLQSVRTDTQTGACQSVVQDANEIDLSVECLDPSSCTSGGSRLIINPSATLRELPIYTTVPATFSSDGSGTISARYEDTGKIRLHAELTATNGFTLRGTSNTVAVRPGAIDVIVTNALNYDDSVFARSGDSLTVQLIAKSTTGQTTENFGNENFPELLTLNTTARTVIPESGVDGIVDVVETFSKQAPGTFVSNDIRYRDVGTIQLTAKNVSGDFLGTGSIVFDSSPIGRILPWDFHVDLDMISTGCAAPVEPFTYLGQSFELTLALTARNRNGTVVQNYPDAAEGTMISLLAQDQDSLRDLTPRLLGRSIQPAWRDGQGDVLNYSLTLSRQEDGTEDGPFETVIIATKPDINSVEALFVPMAGADFRLNSTDCLDEGVCTSKALAEPLRFVFGRLVLDNSFGPETEALPISARAEYWTDGGFRKHTRDSCSSLSPARFSIISEPLAGSADITGIDSTLNKGDLPAGNISIGTGGVAGDVVFEYPAADWLKWGPENNGLPSALATFGVYGGHDRVISWREIYNGSSQSRN